jgi:hypothetical protein
MNRVFVEKPWGHACGCERGRSSLNCGGTGVEGRRRGGVGVETANQWRQREIIGEKNNDESILERKVLV